MEEGMSDRMKDPAMGEIYVKVKGSENAEDQRKAEAREKSEAQQNTNGKFDDNHQTLSLLTQIMGEFPGKRSDVRTYSPLALAYIGDAVYDLIIRTVVVERANRSSQELHRITVKYVSAGAQARIVQALMDSLTEEEAAVYRRGKNSKPHTMAKNASAADYLKATGFEAVLGYLYLTDHMDRILELVSMGIQLAGLKI